MSAYGNGLPYTFAGDGGEVFISINNNNNNNKVLKNAFSTTRGSLIL